MSRELRRKKDAARRGISVRGGRGQVAGGRCRTRTAQSDLYDGSSARRSLRDRSFWQREKGLVGSQGPGCLCSKRHCEAPLLEHCQSTQAKVRAVRERPYRISKQEKTAPPAVCPEMPLIGRWNRTREGPIFCCSKPAIRLRTRGGSRCSSASSAGPRRPRCAQGRRTRCRSPTDGNCRRRRTQPRCRQDRP